MFRDLAIVDWELKVNGEELRATFVEMDLPELGISGPAVVQNIRGSPEIRSGAGRVVTATFHHSSSEVIDLVVGSEPKLGSGGGLLPALEQPQNSTNSIGTTRNHPFWSVDRQDYVQANDLAIGERLLTFSGQTKRVISKRDHPSTESVYNLEVIAEHVYYVGEDGILVHNTKHYMKGELLDESGDSLHEGKYVSGGRKGMGSPNQQEALALHTEPKFLAEIEEIADSSTPRSHGGGVTTLPARMPTQNQVVRTTHGIRSGVCRRFDGKCMAMEYL